MVGTPSVNNNGVATTGESDIEQAAEEYGRRFEWVGRLGWIGKGLVYFLVGILFLQIAAQGGSGSDQANQTGAVEAVAKTPFGSVLLIALAIGLLLYILWRAFSVVMPGDWTGRALLDRGGYLVSVITYSALLFTTIGFLRNREQEAAEKNDRIVEELVKDVLGMTGGQTVVFIAGLVFIVIGIAFVHKGWTRKFRDEISGDQGAEGTLIDRLGTVGWIARGISMGLIGFFLSRAAWLFDPEEAAGLDDSIRQIVDNPLGRALAFVVGAGFAAFGIFAAISSRHRDLKGPTND